MYDLKPKNVSSALQCEQKSLRTAFITGHKVFAIKNTEPGLGSKSKETFNLSFFITCDFDKLKKLNIFQSCSHIKCGDGERYGLSGGERKRLNLACEILSNPEIILLDEPTSGLDASAAKKLILFLRDFAVNENKIVICSIHQPSSFIFQCFHKVLILYEGTQVFFGSPQESIRMLASQGFICPPHYNAAEFFLEVLSDDILHKLPDNKTITSFKKIETRKSAGDIDEDTFRKIRLEQ